MADAGEVTALPACQLGTITVHTDHHLFWVVRGTARVLTAGVRHELREMDALWIPPGVPVDQIATSPGTTALTVLLPVTALPGPPPDVVRRHVPVEFTDLLLHLYSRWISPYWCSDGITPEVAAALRDLFLGGDGPLVPMPGVPVSPAAVRVAGKLLADPGVPQSVTDFAADAGVSPRHLTRLFIGETGLSFTAWRSRVRLCAAERLLREGRTVAETVGILGYGSVASFSRSFRKVAGTGPGRVGRRRRSVEGTHPARGVRDGAVAPGVPAGRLLPVVGRHSVLVWAARGTVRIRFRDGVQDLSQGEVVWLPAGVWHEVETAPGAVLLPVGSLPARVPLTRGDAVPFNPGRGRQDALLYRSAVNHTRLRPHGPSPESGSAGDCDDLLPAGVRTGTPDRCSSVVARILESDMAPTVVATSVRQWARQFSVPAQQLEAEFRRRTGDGHRQWLTGRRMSVSRMLLRSGVSVAGTAEETGYAATSAFVRAFGTCHDTTPGEFRRRHRRHVVFDVVE